MNRFFTLLFAASCLTAVGQECCGNYNSAYYEEDCSDSFDAPDFDCPDACQDCYSSNYGWIEPCNDIPWNSGDCWQEGSGFDGPNKVDVYFELDETSSSSHLSINIGLTNYDYPRSEAPQLQIVCNDTTLGSVEFSHSSECYDYATDVSSVGTWSSQAVFALNTDFLNCGVNIIALQNVHCNGVLRTISWISEGECGCTDENACNYDELATADDGSCLQLDACGVCGGDGIPAGDCDCAGNQEDALGICGGSCASDHDNNGVCDDQEVFGCAYPLADNYNPEVTHDDGSCVFPCVGEVNANVFDWDRDYSVTVTDFLMMLTVFGDVDVDFDGVWDSADECIDTEACNYDADPSEPCQYIDVLGVCGGVCPADADADGVCDDVDNCVGELDECGVCNGPGPTEIVIEDIVTYYDSVFLPVDGVWFVFASEVDTTFTYTCASFEQCGDPVSYQGYNYQTVLIGDQCWFAENLRNENYQNGVEIPSNLSDSDWQNTISGAASIYGEGISDCHQQSPDGDACDEAWSLNEYGRLYNWYAVNDVRGLCPSGWHVPTDIEWTVMTDHLGGQNVAGGQLKATFGWASDGNGTNSSGFSGLPGGWRYSSGGFLDDGVFMYAGERSYFWTSTPQYSILAWFRVLDSSQSIHRILDGYGLEQGFSVRCIKD